MIRSLLLAALTLTLSAASAGKTSASGSVHVSGYTKKDGTYVAPYYRRAPGTAGTTSTTPTVRTYSSCADARADGRWNILRTDPDYSSALDRDSDGIACEAGSDGSSNGRDPDPTGATTSTESSKATTSYTPPPWAIVGLTYPEWLGQHLAWRQDNLACSGEGAAHEQAFLNDGTGASMAWRGTVGFLADLPIASDSKHIDSANAANGIMSRSPWAPSGKYTTQEMWVAQSPETIYLAELRAVGSTKAVVCLTTYVPR